MEHRSVPIIRHRLTHRIPDDAIEEVVRVINDLTAVLDECGAPVGNAPCIRVRGRCDGMHVNIYGQSKAGSNPVRNPTLF